MTALLPLVQEYSFIHRHIRRWDKRALFTYFCAGGGPQKSRKKKSDISSASRAKKESKSRPAYKENFTFFVEKVIFRVRPGPKRSALCPPWVYWFFQRKSARTVQKIFCNPYRHGRQQKCPPYLYWFFEYRQDGHIQKKSRFWNTNSLYKTSDPPPRPFWSDLPRFAPIYRRNAIPPGPTYSRARHQDDVSMYKANSFKLYIHR